MADYKMSMLDNALDFIDYAVSHLEDSDPDTRNLKYAILHLSSGIEQLFKQCLFNKDRKLIFADQSNADEKALQSGDFYTIDFKEALKRLEANCDVKFDDRAAKIFKAIKMQRNKIEHYQLIVDKTLTVALIVKAWAIVYDFCHSYLDVIDNAVFLGIREKILVHQEFIKERWIQIEEALQEAKLHHFILDCPRCFERALPLRSHLKSGE